MLKTDILHIKPFISYLFQNCGLSGKRTYLFMKLYETNKRYRENLNHDAANIPGLINLWKSFINDVVIDRISKYDVAIDLINTRSLIYLYDNDDLWLSGFKGHDGTYCEWEVIAATTNSDSPVRIGSCIADLLEVNSYHHILMVLKSQELKQHTCFQMVLL